MGTFTLPGGWGTPTISSNYGVVPRTLTQSGFSVPNGRTMLNGSKKVMLLAWRAFISGYSGTNTISCAINGVGAVNSTVGAAGSATDTGDKPFSNVLVSPGAASCVFAFSDRIHFGRQTYGPSVVAGSGYSSWGAMVGLMTYAEAPTAPGTPSVSVAADEVTVTWTAPSSNGGSAITGYRLQIASDPGFTSLVAVADPATTPEGPISLAPGTYYARVGAKNAVTTADGTWSVWSATRTFSIQSGAWVKIGGTYQAVPIYQKIAGTYEPLVPYVKQGGIYVPLQ